MDLRARISDGLKQAMRDKDQTRLSTLRLINAAVKDQDIANRGGEGGAQVSDAQIRGILSKMVRQRQESARAYDEGGRLELAEGERAEIAVIEEFLPRQLSATEVEAAIDAAIEETGATSIRDMGKVMAALKTSIPARWISAPSARR